MKARTSGTGCHAWQGHGMPCVHACTQVSRKHPCMGKRSATITLCMPCMHGQGRRLCANGRQVPRIGQRPRLFACQTHEQQISQPPGGNKNRNKNRRPRFLTRMSSPPRRVARFSQRSSVPLSVRMLCSEQRREYMHAMSAHFGGVHTGSLPSTLRYRCLDTSEA